jgi:hypothetical protein
VAVLVDDFDMRQVVALARFEVVGIVRGGDLDHAGAELGVGQIVENDRNLAIHQRRRDGVAVHIGVAWVAHIDSDGGVAKHGFGARCGDGEKTVRAIHRIADVPEAALGVLMNGFEIGQRGVAARAPVHHVGAAVDEAALVEAHEGFGDCEGEFGREGEALARPVDAVADGLHLIDDASAVLALPLPDALFEGLAAELMASDSFFGELAFHHHLRGDAGVIGARQPEGVVAAHAMPAGGGVHDGVVHHVAHVQRAGDVGRRDDHGEYRAGAVRVGAEDVLVDPPLGPRRLETPGLIHFVWLLHELGGKNFSLAGGW